MTILLTATSLYVIASIPYPLAMWSVLGMPHNGHHDHKTLCQWASFSGDTSWIRYIKPHYQIYRTVGRESPERLLPFRHVHFIRDVFDDMSARENICFGTLGSSV